MPSARTTSDKPRIATPEGIGSDTPAPPRVDGRTRAARRHRKICSALAAHLGGSPTAPQQAVILRAAGIQLWLEGQEATQAAGGTLDAVNYVTATNALARLLRDLGLYSAPVAPKSAGRQAAPVPAPPPGPFGRAP